MEIDNLEQAVAAIVQQRDGRDYPMQPPCLMEQIAELSIKVENMFGERLPSGYLIILQITDGIAENALTIYASKTVRNVVSDLIGRELEIPGIIEENQFYRDQDEAYQEVILFARREEYQYAQLIETGQFIQFLDTELDRPPRHVYDTFDEMMIVAIKSALIE
ncbi:MAG: hypothetical protein IT446_01255 [Phycisphaerales bacterium]|nr:hypothetical protein [Phycisphaerales bacterium]